MLCLIGTSFFLQETGVNATTWDMHDTFEQLDKETKGIIELFGHCKGGNFNIHIWALFG